MLKLFREYLPNNSSLPSPSKQFDKSIFKLCSISQKQMEINMILQLLLLYYHSYHPPLPPLNKMLNNQRKIWNYVTKFDSQSWSSSDTKNFIPVVQLQWQRDTCFLWVTSKILVNRVKQSESALGDLKKSLLKSAYINCSTFLIDTKRKNKIQNKLHQKMIK